MKGLLLEFIFLTLLADTVFFGALVPWIKSRVRKETGIADGVRYPKHEITFWNDAGTGHGDDSNGWRCACGVFTVGDDGIERHLALIKRIDRANEKIKELENDRD